VLATNGIHLPVLGAFKLLGSLDGMRLPVSSIGALPLGDVLATGVRGEPDIDALATLDGNAVQVLAWNYHDDLVPVPAAPIHLTVQVPPSFGTSVHVSHLRVDEAHGDAYTVWVAEGMPASPSADQIRAMTQAMEPAPLVPDGTFPVSAGGSVVLDFDLPRFGVSLLTITPSGDVGDARTSDTPEGCACRAGQRSSQSGSSTLPLAVLSLILLTRSGSRRDARCRRKCATPCLPTR
jgi:xylan 1,4-beta-xylosidase